VSHAEHTGAAAGKVGGSIGAYSLTGLVPPPVPPPARTPVRAGTLHRIVSHPNAAHSLLRRVRICGRVASRSQGLAGLARRGWAGATVPDRWRGPDVRNDEGGAEKVAVAARRSSLRTPASRLSAAERWQVAAMAMAIATLFALGITLLAAALPHHYALSGKTTFGIGTGVLALTLGMRHAFDADHISAIDNTTRKLMSEGKRPLSVGFFFSLGHSTVVFVLAVLLNFGIRALDDQVRHGASTLHNVTNIVGTSVSGLFLFLIAALNLVILASILRVFFELRSGRYDDDTLEEQLSKRGLMNRFFGPLARRIDSSWKMYPIGVLFGLGFDTATEIALLVLSGTAVASGLPFYAVLAMPLLFAAGMSAFDALDGCFMNFAYGWAFARPIRKVYYNITITALSVVVALLIGTVEVLGLLSSELDLTGGFWSFVANFNLNTAGFVIVGMFVVTWAIALAVWRCGRIEARWDEAALRARAE
jgi:high-affinity nickel-transport protein